jgi:hypothetical protein
MLKAIISLLLIVSEFGDLTSGKQLELFECNLFLVSEVPLDKVFEFALLELEASSLNELLEFLNLNGVGLLVFYSEEEALKEHVVLLLIGELVGVRGLVRLHKVAEFVLSQILAIGRQTLHDGKQRGLETFLCLLVRLRVHWTTQQVEHEISRTFNGYLAICLEVEEKGAENLKSHPNSTYILVCYTVV